MHLNHAEGDGDDEEAFEKRLAALKGKRGTPSRSNSNSSGGGDDALTPYQQLKQNQAEQKDRKKTGARALCRCSLPRTTMSSYKLCTCSSQYLRRALRDHLTRAVQTPCADPGI